MNDLERLKQLMNEYKQTSETLCDMLDDYLETSEKPLESVSNEKRYNCPKE